MKLRRTTDRALWEELVGRFDEALFFHGWDWLDLQEHVLGVTFERLVVHDDGSAIGVFPVPRASRRSPKGFGPPFPFLGPLVPLHRLPDTLHALKRWQVSTGLLTARVEFGFALAAEVEEPVRAAGLRIRNDSTVVVDVSHGSADELMSGYSSLRRRDVRRAVRDGGSVRPARPGEISEIMPQVLDEAFGVRGVKSIVPANTGPAIEQFAAGRPDVGLFTALVGEEPAGMQVVVRRGPTALAWTGASLRRFRNVNVNALLYHQLLEWAIEQGCQQVDLCGAIDDGVLRYKVAFGGQVRPWLIAESSLVPQRVIQGVRVLRARPSRSSEG